MLQALREKGFFHLVSANVLTQGIAFLAGIILTKLLTPSELGATRIIQSYFLVLFVLGGAGMAAAVLRYGSVEEFGQSPNSIFAAGARRGFIQGFAVAAMFAAFALLAGISPMPGLNLGLAIFALAIPFSVLSDIGIQFLQSQHRAREVAGLQIINRSAAAGFALVGAYAAGFWGWVAGGVATWVFSAGNALRKIGFANALVPAAAPAGMGAYAGMALIGNGILAVSQSLDFFLLDRLVADRAAIGHYAFAVLFLMAATQLSGAMQAIVIPMLTQRHREVAWVRGQALRMQGIFFLLAVAAAILMIAMVFGLVRIGFPEYARSPEYVAILMVRFVSLAGSAVCVAAILALGEVRLHVAALAAGTAIALSATWWATAEHGVYGTAWGQAAGGVATAVCQWAALMFALRAARSRQDENDGEPPPSVGMLGP